MLWKIGLGFCEVQRLTKTRLPKPGDIFYADQPFQHHAVVAAVTNSGIDTIDGNQGGPRPVQAKHRAFSDRWIFYSIEPFLKGVTVPEPIPPALKRVELKRGDKSDAVAELQTLLNKAKLGIAPLVVDRDFGAKTENAVKAFQTSRGLVPNGVVGAATWLRLDELQ